MKHALAITTALLLTPLAHAADPIIIADFEGSDYGAWKTTGDAFGKGPAHGILPGQRPVEGFQGKGLANSFHGADNSTGKLTSPEFKIERKFITFLIGGGGFAGKTCMNLLVNGRVVRTAVGENTEKLVPTAWDVREFAEKSAQIQVVDDATGGMGHIMVDQIVETDAAGQLIANAIREFTAEKHYLNIPQSYKGDKRRVTLLVDGKPESAFGTFKMALADEKPDWWAFRDISNLKGRTIALQVDRLPETSTALQAVEQSDQLKDTANLYHEERRPQLYFSPKLGSCGDANGLVFYKGEYHLFFQHNPYGRPASENTHWGHAVSTDLVHWEELPSALSPDDNGKEWSGSAVVDWNNTSGFQTGEEKPLVITYASAGRSLTQCVAYSNDKGRTWTKYSGNPVLPFLQNANRDPRVTWYAPEKKWVMALAFGHDSRQNGGKPTTNPNYGLFASKDLKSWEQTSTLFIDNTCDCPEFFEIALDGDPAKKKWIFYSGDAAYLVGTFDGKTFTPESGPHRLNQGNNFYASQTFSDIPAQDGRRIMMAHAWSGGNDASFDGAISLPVELTLRTADDQPQLYVYPVRELEKLRVKTLDIAPQPLQPGNNPLNAVRGELLEVVADITVADTSKITFSLRGIIVTYDAQKQELTCQNRTAPLKPVGGKFSLRAYVDRTSVTIFANDGRVYMPMGTMPSASNLTLDLTATGGEAKIQSLQVHELKSIWEAAPKVAASTPPPNDQDFTLGDARTIPEPKPKLSIYDYAPDGHYTVFRTGDSLMMFWPGHDSYRTMGPSIFEMGDSTKVLPMGEPGDFDNGGRWLYSVFRRGERGMLGFYHAEDQKFPLDPECKWKAFKSIARCTSDDLGLTWSNRERILTSHEPKPEKGAWSGLGDHCMVWDEKNQRFVCFFQEGAILCMAMSEDPEGRPGSWKKWFEGGFTEPGLGGRATPIPALASHRGGNPSVLWNTFLQQWVMVWHRWAGDLWISTSADLLAWSPPKLLLSKPSDAGKAWYPTLIGESDQVGGEHVTLIYAEFPESKNAYRKFQTRELVFRKKQQ